MKKDQENELEIVNDYTQSQDIDLNRIATEAQSVCALFEEMGIKEATLINGNYYNHNQETGEKLVVTKGCIVEDNENTMTIILKKTDAPSIDAVNEIKGRTQKALGSFVGKSQPWISDNTK